MRVLLWSPAGAGVHYGGAGMAAYRLYKEVRRKYPEVKVDLAHGCHLQDSENSCGVFDRMHMVGDWPTPSPARGRGGFLMQAGFLRSGVAWIAKHAGEYDVVHGIGAYEVTTIPLLTARLRGRPVVVKVTKEFAGAGSDGTTLRPIDRLRMVGLARVDTVIAISERIEETLLNAGLDKRNVKRIPNGVDTSRFFPIEAAEARRDVRARLGLQDLFTLLFSGALIPRKRPHLVIEAVQEVARRSGRMVQVVFVGPEANEQYFRALREAACGSELAALIRFVGFVHNVDNYYQAADIAILPSQEEGLSNAVLEAAATGLPVIATPASGMKDILGGQAPSGMIVDPTPRAIGDGILHYLEKPELVATHSRNARMKVQERFSLRTVVDAHLSLFEGLAPHT
jgi:glycosyltransferase involved in cell wall biosynthesis